MKSEERGIHSPEVLSEVIETICSMKPEELLDFMEYRTPGIEETDMTGQFPINPERPIPASSQPLQKKSA